MFGAVKRKGKWQLGLTTVVVAFSGSFSYVPINRPEETEREFKYISVFE